MKLGHVLQSTLRVNIELDSFRSDELKRAARFWVGQGSRHRTTKKTASLP